MLSDRDRLSSQLNDGSLELFCRDRGAARVDDRLLSGLDSSELVHRFDPPEPELDFYGGRTYVSDEEEFASIAMATRAKLLAEGVPINAGAIRTRMRMDGYQSSRKRVPRHLPELAAPTDGSSPR